jgi:hypothetical protein
MFGKTGVFCDGLMFGIVTDDTLYLLSVIGLMLAGSAVLLIGFAGIALASTGFSNILIIWHLWRQRDRTLVNQPAKI